MVIGFEKKNAIELVTIFGEVVQEIARNVHIYASEEPPATDVGVKNRKS